MGLAEHQDRPHKKAKLANKPAKSALKNPKSSDTGASRSAAGSSSAAAAVSDAKSTAVAASLKKDPTNKKKEVAIHDPEPKPVQTAKIDKGKGKAIEPLPQYPTKFKVVAGSYEKLLYGLEGTFVGEDGGPLEQPQLKPIFIFPAHVSCVKAVGTSPDGGKWLVTGSTDEIIKVWDLRRKKEVGGLIQHEGSITQLCFATRSHLFSTSEDGTICVFHARDWSVLRTLNGHKGRVNSVAVHPSMKVALSVGKDRTLRMWDLMRGKGSGSTKIGKEGELVRWSAKGDRFVVQSGSTIDIYSVDMKLLHTFSHPSRVQDVRFFLDSDGTEYLLVGAEDKKVTFYGLESESSTSLPVVAEAAGHANRVKAIDILQVATPAGPRTSTSIMSTASSDGWIRIFDIGHLAQQASKVEENRILQLQSITGYDTKGTRLTCCALADGEAIAPKVTGKRKSGDADEEEDHDDALLEDTGAKNAARAQENEGSTEGSEDESNGEE